MRDEELCIEERSPIYRGEGFGIANIDLNITILRAHSSIVTSQIYIYLTVLSMQVVNQRIDLSPLPINAKI